MTIADMGQSRIWRQCVLSRILFCRQCKLLTWCDDWPGGHVGHNDQNKQSRASYYLVTYNARSQDRRPHDGFLPALLRTGRTRTQGPSERRLWETRIRLRPVIDKQSF